MKHADMSKDRNTRQRSEFVGVGRLLAVLMCATILLVPFVTSAGAQDTEAQPTQDPALQLPNDPTAPQPDEEETPVATEPPAAKEPEPTKDPDTDTSAAEEPEPTTEPDTGTPTTNEPQVTRSTQRSNPATGPGFPAVLTHGLAYVTGEDLVWQVRETEMPSVDKARSTISNAALMLQRDGASIVRNDVTGKRAKMDPGESYFRAAGDGYTVMAEDGESLVWMFELVDPDDVALDAFYESPKITDLDEGVYDMMLTRYVLTPGDTVDLPQNSGAGLVMVATGETEIQVDDDRAVLEAGDGQTIQESATVTNTSDDDVVFVYAHLGDEIGNASAGSGQASSGTTTTNGSGSESGDSTSESTIQDTGDTDDAGTLQDQAEESEGAPDIPATDDAGNYITSINVTADAEIYLVITVDGLTVFDGTLPAGQSSGPVVGTNFTVYTSSGVNTNFTNACGDYFKMGYEEGEVTYTLTATESSCAP